MTVKFNLLLKFLGAILPWAAYFAVRQMCAQLEFTHENPTTEGMGAFDGGVGVHRVKMIPQIGIISGQKITFRTRVLLHPFLPYC